MQLPQTLDLLLVLQRKRGRRKAILSVTTIVVAVEGLTDFTGLIPELGY